MLDSRLLRLTYNDANLAPNDFQTRKKNIYLIIFSAMRVTLSDADLDVSAAPVFPMVLTSLNTCNVID